MPRSPLNSSRWPVPSRLTANHEKDSLPLASMPKIRRSLLAQKKNEMSLLYSSLPLLLRLVSRTAFRSERRMANRLRRPS